MRVASVCFRVILFSVAVFCSHGFASEKHTDFNLDGKEVSRDSVWTGGSLRVWVVCERDSSGKDQSILYAFKLKVSGSWSLERTFTPVSGSEAYNIGDTVLVGSYTKAEKRLISSGFSDTERELVFSPKVLARLGSSTVSYLRRREDNPQKGEVKFMFVPRLIGKLGYTSPDLIKLAEIKGKWVIQGVFTLLNDPNSEPKEGSQ